MNVPAPAVPKFFNDPPQRQVEAGLEPALADIECRMPVGHIYRVGDHSTWTHEATHGLNSRLRGTMYIGGPQVNAAYVLHGRYVRFPEPKTTLGEVAKYVPAAMRGMSFNLYLGPQNRQWWDDCPLNIFDEWSAYANGAQATWERGELENRASDLQQALEFSGYAMILLWILWLQKNAYSSLLALRDFVAWHTERVFTLYRDTVRVGRASPGQNRAFQAFSTSQDMLRFLQDHACGLEWYARVFGERAWGGVF